jgi:hypothetical protein
MRLKWNRRLRPKIIRTRERRGSNDPHLGDNVIIVPVSGITKENMIMIGFDAARLIRETSRHGNDYLRNAKVLIAAK